VNESDGIGAYALAWLETDPQARAVLLERAWAPEAVYCDPTAYVEGRAALNEHITAVQIALPGHAVTVTGEASRHHDSAHFPWAITGPEGAVVVTGFDVVQLDGHGRITRLTGFFD
jgi:hypothetical protein